MSRPFAKYPAKPTFAQLNEPLDANEYITNKKNKYSFCSQKCHLNKNVYSESNAMSLKKSNLAFYPCKNVVKLNQLYSNLYTQLDLSGNILVIADLSGNTYPVTISTSVVPYLKYYIDLSGNLFGNSVCDINNFKQYITFDTPTSASCNT